MLSLLKKLRSASYTPLNKITISQNRLIKNYQTLKSINPSIKIAPVLKSNAYGHGLIQISSIIDRENPPFICVDSLPEANILKKNGVKSPILIMGSISGQSLEKPLPYHLTIISLDSLHTIKKLQPKAKVHVFIDTGMNREGVTLKELDTVITEIENSQLELVGVMTHLAIANDKNHQLTKKQITNFKQAKIKIHNSKLNPKWFHIGGSDCITWVDPELINMVRTGRFLYGVQSHGLKNLEPVLQLESTIVQIKQLKKGESIGYSATYTAQKDITIALLPIGYNDGVDRRLSNKGSVLIRGKQCPFVGLISMNMTVVDITSLKENIEIGDTVIIYSNDQASENSIEKSSLKADTNPSDLLVGINPSGRREVV